MRLTRAVNICLSNSKLRTQKFYEMWSYHVSIAEVQSCEANVQSSAPGFKSGMYVILGEFILKHGISTGYDNK